MGHQHTKGKMGSTVEEEYGKMCQVRSPFLRSAEKYSEMSLPYIMPRSGTKNTEGLNQHGYQSICADGVNNLANKMVQTLFPVNQPFFSLDVDSSEAIEDSEKLKEINLEFNKITRIMQRHFKSLKLRSKLVLFMKHLIIAGNCALVRDVDGHYRLFSLNNYCVARDHRDRLVKMILLEKIMRGSLPGDAQTKLKQEARLRNVEIDDKDKSLKLFTKYEFDYANGVVNQIQTIDDVVLYEESIPLKENPAIVCRWNESDCEDYGRGHMEDVAGDAFVVNMLSKARATGAAVMMEVRYLIKRGAALSVSDLEKSENGDTMIGEEGDVSLLQLEKYADKTLITDVINECETRLNKGFMNIQSAVRDSERTTAYEISLLAADLDLNKGGIYSTLGDDLQKPLAQGLMNDVLGKDLDPTFEPNITTGLDALGTAGELQKLQQFTQYMALPSSWPEALQQATDFEALGAHIAKHLAMETHFIKPKEQLQKDQAGQTAVAGSTAFNESLGSTLGKNAAENMIQK